MIHLIIADKTNEAGGKLDNATLKLLKNKYKHHALFEVKTDEISPNDKVLFIFNEVNMLKNKSIYNTLISITKILLNKSVIIFNNPILCSNIGKKSHPYILTNEINCSVIRSPKFKLIDEVNSLNEIDFFPIILKYDIDCCGQEYICNNLENAKINFCKFKNKKSIIAIEFINSINPSTQQFTSLRLMVHNKQIKSIIPRSGATYNVHTKDIVLENYSIVYSSYIDWINENKEQVDYYLNELYKVYGNGFYAHDFLLNCENNTLYCCEHGLKIQDYSGIHIINKLKLNDKFKIYNTSAIESIVNTLEQ